MDLADRIKIFINFLAIGSSQFADNCKIPRPTLSQILNGRNKKISDEIIGKIHQTYPTLSVLWLMFGEGDMVIDANTRISEPQEGGIIDFGEQQHTNTKPIAEYDNIQFTIPDFNAEKNSTGFSDNPAPTAMEKAPKNKENARTLAEAGESSINFQIPPIAPSSSDGGSRRIVNIMVFYSDNSFESFTPTTSTTSTMND